MRARLIEQIISLVFVALTLAVLAVIGNTVSSGRESVNPAIDRYLTWTFMDFGNPMHRELFRESIAAYPHLAPDGVDSLLSAIESRRREVFIRPELKSGHEVETLSLPTFVRLGGMYVQFVLVYALVLLITYQAAQAIAIYRFIRTQQQLHTSPARVQSDPSVDREFEVQQWLKRALGGTIRGILYAVLFAPAYVIAYTLRSRFETDTLPFMIGLGVISNGLLISYANRLYALLISESRKGYVQTAIVKNLHASYRWGGQDGIAISSLMTWKKRFPGHVFDHIYRNAHFQWMPTLKEHGAFLITGLIIIEMALNIQGRLCYELLQQILFRNFPIVAVIIFALFLVVKVTEMCVDVWAHRDAQRYDNAV